MLDISVIILTYNEELHLRRCLDNVCPLVRAVFLIDCFSTDRTLDIACEYPKVRVLQHAWPAGQHAEQFNWALDNAPIETSWVMRLDADEYLTPELAEELQVRLPALDGRTGGIVLPLHRYFLGRRIRHGIAGGIRLLRIFRAGAARSEMRLMDEHLKLMEGEVVEFRHGFCDHNLNDLGWWVRKHVGYATREAADLLNLEFQFRKPETDGGIGHIEDQALKKRRRKERYARAPLFWRSALYFLYRYVFRLGFLDGKEGFLWDFLQGWWYRTLVDARVYEIKKACGNDPDRIRRHLAEHHGLFL